MEDIGRPSRDIEGNPRQNTESHASGRKFEKLRPVELHAGEAGRDENVEQLRKGDAN